MRSVARFAAWAMATCLLLLAAAHVLTSAFASAVSNGGKNRKELAKLVSQVWRLRFISSCGQPLQSVPLPLFDVLWEEMVMMDGYAPGIKSRERRRRRRTQLEVAC